MKGQDKNRATEGSTQNMGDDVITTAVIEAVTATVKKLLPEQERDDAVQETLLRLWQYRLKPLPEATPREAWAVGIAQNVCRMHYRSKAVEQANVGEWPDDDAHILDVVETETPMDLLLAVEACQERLKDMEQDMRSRRRCESEIQETVARKIGR